MVISVLPMVKKMIIEKINQIKLGIMRNIMPNNLKRDEILRKGYLIEQ